MLQFSIYTKHCASKENAEVHIKRIQNLVPKKGHVSILTITDKQYSTIYNVVGQAFRPMENVPQQLELF